MRYLLNVLSVLMEVTGMNPNSYQAQNGSHRLKDRNAASSWRIFSRSNRGLIEYLQNISSELSFLNLGGHLKTVVSAET